MPRKTLVPYWTTSDRERIRLYCGDALDVLQCLPSESVHMCVTSPPYWGMRGYKAGKAELGSERTVGEYVTNLVVVFRELKRVLRSDGTFWLNLGDTYGAGNNRNGLTGTIGGNGRKPNNPALSERSKQLPSGNVYGVPWRVAFALQEDGWILRQEIIWAKTNCMPEPVKSRCVKAHEQLFLLSKGMDYYFDHVAIQTIAKEPWKATKAAAPKYGKENGTEEEFRYHGGSTYHSDEEQSTANKRDVWYITNGGSDCKHLAPFPQKLIEPCILAGTSAGGCCAKCGKNYERSELKDKRVVPGIKRWSKTCGCETDVVKPCVVLDPFIGSGTTAIVSARLGRNCWGIELSETYLKEDCLVRLKGKVNV